MATLKVVTPFTVQLDPVPPPEIGTQPTTGTREADAPTKYVFPVAGTYENVPEEVAAHPYTQPHLEGYEPPTEAEVTGTVVMVPIEEPPVTQAEAESVLRSDQRAEIARQRSAEERAARTAAARPPERPTA